MRNVKIAYWLSFLGRSWFWLGVWILYYLRFTDYAGIGLLETIMIMTATLSEVPTGAVADLVGKRKAIVLAFVLGTVGHVVMAIAPNYWVLAGSIVTMTIGGAFYSGSMEALVYDTLKERKREGEYQRSLGRMVTMQNLGMALTGVVGGYLYQVNPSIPFFLTGVAYAVGAGLSFWLVEPQVDSEKFSWKNFVKHNKQGFGQLFHKPNIMRQTWLLLIPGALMIATDNVLNDATALEYGFSAVQLGILATILYLFGAAVSHWSEKVMSWLRRNVLFVLMIIIYVGSMVLTPYPGMYLGALLLIVRWGVQTLFSNYSSVTINEQIESKYRATTLSTFVLLKNIPYALGATGIGILMNLYTAKVFSQYLGLAVGAIVLLLLLGGMRITETRDS